MQNIFSKVNGFIRGLGAILMTFIPVTILWYVLTGGSVFGMDVVANLSALVNALGSGGFVGFIVLIILWMLLDNGDKK